MGYEHILLDRDGEIGVVTINRPKVLNALRTDVLRELASCFKELAIDDSVKVVVITGAGDKAFVAGADISEMAILTPTKAKEFSEFGNSVFLAIDRFPKPVVAALNGYALGGGCELLLSCD
ncbi:MAG: enoyl-CoA hydratase-related protein, partial [Methanomassiliicoccales archaeon]|nr:enoyl-CoA hydratase-related protein [Methanomassiliicoccales archaeon]